MLRAAGCQPDAGRNGGLGRPHTTVTTHLHGDPEYGLRAGPFFLLGHRRGASPRHMARPSFRQFIPCAVRVEVNCLHWALVFGSVRSCFVPVLAKERQHALFNAHQNHRTKHGTGRLLGSIGLLPHRRTRHPCVDRRSQPCTDTPSSSGNPTRNGFVIVRYKMQLFDF